MFKTMLLLDTCLWHSIVTQQLLIEFLPVKWINTRYHLCLFCFKKFQWWHMVVIIQKSPTLFCVYLFASLCFARDKKARTAHDSVITFDRQSYLHNNEWIVVRTKNRKHKWYLRIEWKTDMHNNQDVGSFSMMNPRRVYYSYKRMLLDLQNTF